MAIKYSFVDSTTYGTEDVNDITRSLTGAGVAPFMTKDSYNVSDLNTMTSAVVEAGVQLGGCEVSISNPATEDMAATVAQGIVFFESGVRLEVDNEGYTIGVTSNTAGHIFAYYSPALQTADVLFATDLPTDGECVLLANVSEKGKVEDRRSFAQSKIATIGKNVVLTKELIPLETPRLLSVDGNYGKYVVSKVTGVDISKFNYIVVYTNSKTDGLWSKIAFMDIAKQIRTLYISGGDAWATTDYALYSSAYGSYNLAFVEGELALVATYRMDKLSTLGSYQLTARFI